MVRVRKIFSSSYHLTSLQLLVDLTLTTITVLKLLSVSLNLNYGDLFWPLGFLTEELLYLIAIN